jgi:TM2 domain
MERANSGIAYLLWCLCFFGICGGQRFYVGKIGSGLIYLCTFGLFGIGQLLDLAFIPGMVEKRNAKLRQLEGRVQGRSAYYEPTVTRNLDQIPQAPAPMAPMQKLLKVAKEHGGQLSKAQIAFYTELDPDEVKDLLETAVRAGYADVMNDPSTGAVRYYFDI